MSGSRNSSSVTTFPVPSSLTDLEGSPYNLLPYPVDFDDEDEATRSNSFDKLVKLIEIGNDMLSSTIEANSSGTSMVFSSISALFDPENAEEQRWCGEERMQALYTLVRKSASLAPSTKRLFIQSLCHAVRLLCSVLVLSAKGGACHDALVNQSFDDEANDSDEIKTPSQIEKAGFGVVVSNSFRDALACHVYMLYSLLSALENSIKHNNEKSSQSRSDQADAAEARESCANSMLLVARTMGEQNSSLWKQGVADEDIVALPCRVAYQMIENSKNVALRKAASGDAALEILAITLDNSASIVMNTIVGALVDLLHSFDHVAAMVAELCCQTRESDQLVRELLRGFGRMDVSKSSSDANGKASGVSNFAPFISELASQKPGLVLDNLSSILPFLGSEVYQLRSAIVTAFGYILASDELKEISESTVMADPHGDSSQVDENSKRRKTQNSLLDILEKRVYDNTSFTRAAALKCWAYLICSDAIPLNRVLSVTSLAIDRLQDKSVNVRRTAMQVLTVMLENNPFMGNLNPEPYKRKIEELEKFLEENMPESVKASLKVAELARKQREEQEFEKGEKSVTDECLQAAAVDAALAESERAWKEPTPEEVDYEAKQKALQYAVSAIEFIDLFQNANHAFESMLLSNVTTDVTEALRFFVRARHFQLPCAMTGMRRALSLMWSTEKSIREEVMQAFINVFIIEPGSSDLLPNNIIAQNLLILVGSATESENASIEEAIGQLIRDKKIPSEVFLIIWSVASNATGEAKSAALLVLAMASSADPGIVDSLSRLRLLLDTGFGDRCHESRDWASMRSAAIALQKIGRIGAEVKENSAKSIVLEQLVDSLSCVVRGDWCRDNVENDTLMWFSACEQAINAIVAVCKNPEHVCAEIVRSLEESVLRGSTLISPLRLSRLFFVLGHIAIKLLVYSEELCSAVRRSNAAKALSTQEKVDKAQCESESHDAMEDELGMAAEAEAETERQFADITEKELIGRGILGLFGPLLLRVVANESGQFSDEVLVQSSSLALAKFMCISCSFCEKHLPLLFTVLTRANENVRANIVVALGDLAFRFPNEVEPYTPKIYACLKDKSIRVRRHTMMVLTHLILNDMVKVKGQVCEVAICMQDSDINVRDMARLLFNELSKRTNNPVYNLLPDIISRLSSSDLSRDTFREILGFLLSFITKERQIDMLVEKIIQRFPGCETIEQKSNLAYCIAQLKLTDKGVKTLLDNFKLYKDSLYCDDIYKTFLAMVSKLNKTTKPEKIQLVQELESKLKASNESGKEDVSARNKAAKAKQKSVRRNAKRDKHSSDPLKPIN